MPNTFTQIHLQFVFAVNGRQNLIQEPIRDRIEKYITGIAQKYSHKVLAIYCMPDHTHLFVGYRPVQSIPDFMREVKSSSSKFINDEKLLPDDFNWQEGYGAFSYSQSQVRDVVDYVRFQPKHHQNKTFKQEYYAFLRRFEIPFEEKYLFEWIE